jgi:DNA-binding NarL/FixJ family response regulator
MNTQHLFLCANASRPSPRWLEAFPQGRKVDAATLNAQIADGKTTSYIVWLGTDNPQWRQTLQQTTASHAGTRFVVVTGSPEPAEGLSALDAGAMGYTHSYALPELLREVAMVVDHGGLWAGPDLIKRLVASTSAALARLPEPAHGPGTVAQGYAKAWATLSAREAQVASHVAQGKSNKEVADQLFVSERTIKAHLGSIFEKLGVRDRLQLALLVAAIPVENRVIKDTSP